MSYTPPSATSVDFTWEDHGTYTPPPATAVPFTWLAGIPDVTGTGAATVAITGAAVATAGAAGVGAATVSITGEGAGYFGDLIVGTGEAVVPITGAAVALTGAVGVGVASVPITASGTALAGATGAAAASVPISGGAVASHPRYELRGVVKIGDVLVNRRVRAYNRDSGELVGQADTVAGVFAIHAGFTEDEFYVTPIDLDPDAVDWKPPTANRVLSVLAEDTA